LKTLNVEQEEPKLTITTNEQMQKQSDVILWTSTKPNEPGWQSSWGYGRPEPVFYYLQLLVLHQVRFYFLYQLF
jgi:hypothetical protein